MNLGRGCGSEEMQGTFFNWHPALDILEGSAFKTVARSVKFVTGYGEFGSIEVHIQ